MSGSAPQPHVRRTFQAESLSTPPHPTLQESPAPARVSAAVRSLLLQFLLSCEAPPERYASHLDPVGAQQALLLPSGSSTSGHQVAKKKKKKKLGANLLFSQNENLKTEDGSVSNSAPDICIAHKLHLECGRLINLFDWLEVSPCVE